MKRLIGWRRHENTGSTTIHTGAERGRRENFNVGHETPIAVAIRPVLSTKGWPMSECTVGAAVAVC